MVRYFDDPSQRLQGDPRAHRQLDAPGAPRSPATVRLTWSLINPLATLAIYWLVFGFFLKISLRGDRERARLVRLLPGGSYRGTSSPTGSTQSRALVERRSDQEGVFPAGAPRRVIIAFIAVTMLIELSVLGVSLHRERRDSLSRSSSCSSCSRQPSCRGSRHPVGGQRLFLDTQHLMRSPFRCSLSRPDRAQISLRTRHRRRVGVQIPPGDIHRLNPIVVFTVLSAT